MSVHAKEMALKPAFLGASSGRQKSPNHRQASPGPDVQLCSLTLSDAALAPFVLLLGSAQFMVLALP